MEVQTIVLMAVVLILLYIVVAYVMSGPSVLTANVSAKTAQTVESTKLDNSNSAAANFTYSIWFYLDDWNYRIGEPKVIFSRASDADNVCPLVQFKDYTNSIDIKVRCSNSSATSPTNVTDTCTVNNIPIQKWVHLLISVYNKTVDVYLDGKLVKTHILSYPPKVDAIKNSPVQITPGGGFSGWTNRFQYWPDATNPQMAWNIYQEGYGGNWVTNLFSQYSVKLAVMEGDKEASSITI